MRRTTPPHPARLVGTLTATALGVALIWSVFLPQIAAVSASSQANARILGQRFIKMGASPEGKSKILLRNGKLVHRAVCFDQGAGRTRLEIQAKSHKSSGKVLSSNGSLSLKPAWQQLWFAQDDDQLGFAQSYDVLYKDGSYRHFQVDVFINGMGNRCVARLVATTA